MVATADIADKVRNRIANIPSAITDTIIEEYVSDSIIEVQNLTGESITSSAIDTKYQAALTDMGVIKVLRYMLQPSFSLGGELSINRRETLDLIRDLEKKVSKDLNGIIIFGSTSVFSTEPSLNLP
jgi:hypothetical protein